MNTISVIIAIYNRKDELFELLNSLSHQTDKDFEVIIVDDGSAVDLRHTADLFSESLSMSFYRKENSGPGLSRNYGARRAKNDWLVFVDSDVIVETDYIQNIKNNIQHIPCDAFGGADKAHKGFNLMQKAISYSMTSVFTTGGIRGSIKAVTKFQPRSFNMGVRKTAFEKVAGLFTVDFLDGLAGAPQIRNWHIRHPAPVQRGADHHQSTEADEHPLEMLVGLCVYPFNHDVCLLQRSLLPVF